jgi:hypothetical protein
MAPEKNKKSWAPRGRLFICQENAKLSFNLDKAVFFDPGTQQRIA